jgi:hypothetical protein
MHGGLVRLFSQTTRTNRSSSPLRFASRTPYNPTWFDGSLRSLCGVASSEHGSPNARGSRSTTQAWRWSMRGITLWGRSSTSRTRGGAIWDPAQRLSAVSEAGSLQRVRSGSSIRSVLVLVLCSCSCSCSLVPFSCSSLCSSKRAPITLSLTRLQGSHCGSRPTPPPIRRPTPRCFSQTTGTPESSERGMGGLMACVSGVGQVLHMYWSSYSMSTLE